MAGYPPPYPPPPGAPFGYDPRQQKQFLREQARLQKAAFRAQRELYRAQQRGLKRGSLVGPVVVLSLGIVLLLVELGKLSWITVGDWYMRWWPLLLVGAGVVLLVEWAIDQKTIADGAPPIRRGIGAGIVFLLIMLAITGVSLQGLKDHHDAFAHGFAITPDNIDEVFGEKHELPAQVIDQAFVPGTSLTIDDPRGDVSVMGKSDDGQVHLSINKEIYATTDDSVQSKSDRLNPSVTVSGGVMTISLQSVDGGSADVTVMVPEGAQTTVNSDHGAVSVTGIKAPVNVTANHGDIELRQIGGSVTAHINHRGSSFSAHDVTGAVALKGDADDVTVEDVAGQVSLEGDFYGDTHLEHLHAPVSFQTSRTHFTLARLDGQIDIDSSDISGSEIVGPTLLRVHNRVISFERVAGDVDITNTNGAIDLSAAAPLGNITVNNSNGGVTLTVPEHSGLMVDAETKGGDVENDLSLNTSSSNDRKSMSGTVGDGAAKISIRTTHMDIGIHKGMVMAPVAPAMPGVAPVVPVVPVKPPVVKKAVKAVAAPVVPAPPAE